MRDASMLLPTGKTCAACAHVERCVAFGFSSRSATACDFAPSRFVEKVAPVPRATGGYVSPLWPPPGDPRAAHHCKKGEPCRCGSPSPAPVIGGEESER
jgi:hypothetical protein